ncbi:unnamed protein product [Prorocentrum cordatum]|uniref:Alpha 1,4-glycosyltransferase domain-containing protein n=1 Tax=Prorocentrum cordatum TaxID=2364126 RepID=A0ABN9VXZ2_9DINO|nr:unnamed protein product [Polarella glacialis]
MAASLRIAIVQCRYAEDRCAFMFKALAAALVGGAMGGRGAAALLKSPGSWLVEVFMNRPHVPPPAPSAALALGLLWARAGQASAVAGATPQWTHCDRPANHSALGHRGVPKKLWSFWSDPDSARLPKICQLAAASWQVYASGYEIHLLHAENWNEFLTDAQILRGHGPGAGVTATTRDNRFADWLRAVLLAELGGVWIDASIVLTAPLGLLIHPDAQISGVHLSGMLPPSSPPPTAAGRCTAGGTSSSASIPWATVIGRRSAAGHRLPGHAERGVLRDRLGHHCCPGPLSARGRAVTGASKDYDLTAARGIKLRKERSGRRWRPWVPARRGARSDPGACQPPDLSTTPRRVEAAPTSCEQRPPAAGGLHRALLAPPAAPPHTLPGLYPPPLCSFLAESLFRHADICLSASPSDQH